jgi:hypothetical protein
MSFLYHAILLEYVFLYIFYTQYFLFFFVFCLKDRFPKYKDICDKVEKMKTTNSKEKDGPDKSLIGPYQVKTDIELFNMIAKTEYVFLFFFLFFK